ncbi:HAD family hydrolase [Shewanella sp. YIC-542]|uniref:HAD family hydrolase n=1 Tax=Shewanella mytili TaxID=3377111 RepID=UPI00398EF8CB
MDALLLCTDLDRTLLPNGPQPESPLARLFFARVVATPGIQLAYVSGRNLSLVQQAISQYQLPWPDFMVTDVGSMIYRREANGYHPLPGWQRHMAADWPHFNSQRLAQALGALPHLQLQPAAQQQPYKLSYQCVPSGNMHADIALLRRRLATLALQWQIVSSIDETRDMGLVDILPARAGKRPAIDFLVQQLGLAASRVFFSGDSGNDLDVLISPYRTVLVKNATPAVVKSALAGSHQQGNHGRLYLAKGMAALALNGNYSAGIVEGLLHFFPGLKARMLAEGSCDE